MKIFNFFSCRFENKNRERTSGSMQIFLKNPDFFPFVLQQQLSTLDFVCYCGGSLGLFLGFSTLSAFEIVYYFTLRILCLKTQRKKVNCAEIERIKERNHFIEVIESSSIHGFNQTVRKNRHFIERFVW
jgi:hypothetical protein